MFQGILKGANNKAIAAGVVAVLAGFIPDIAEQLPWLEEAIAFVVGYVLAYFIPNANGDNANA